LGFGHLKYGHFGFGLLELGHFGVSDFGFSH
jgi:hypothetical protein